MTGGPRKRDRVAAAARDRRRRRDRDAALLRAAPAREQRHHALPARRHRSSSGRSVAPARRFVADAHADPRRRRAPIRRPSRPPPPRWRRGWRRTPRSPGWNAGRPRRSPSPCTSCTRSASPTSCRISPTPRSRPCSPTPGWTGPRALSSSRCRRRWRSMFSRLAPSDPLGWFPAILRRFERARAGSLEVDGDQFVTPDHRHAIIFVGSRHSRARRQRATAAARRDPARVRRREPAGGRRPGAAAGGRRADRRRRRAPHERRPDPDLRAVDRRRAAGADPDVRVAAQHPHRLPARRRRRPRVDHRGAAAVRAGARADAGDRIDADRRRDRLPDPGADPSRAGARRVGRRGDRPRLDGRADGRHHDRRRVHRPRSGRRSPVCARWPSPRRWACWPRWRSPATCCRPCSGAARAAPPSWSAARPPASGRSPGCAATAAPPRPSWGWRAWPAWSGCRCCAGATRWPTSTAPTPRCAPRPIACAPCVSRVDEGRLVIASARDEEEALRLNDAVAARLERARRDGLVSAVVSLHSFLWSADLQNRSRAAVAAVPDLAGRTMAALAREGFKPEAFEPFRRTAAALHAAAGGAAPAARGPAGLAARRRRPPVHREAGRRDRRADLRPRSEGPGGAGRGPRGSAGRAHLRSGEVPQRDLRAFPRPDAASDPDRPRADRPHPVHPLSPLASGAGGAGPGRARRGGDAGPARRARRRGQPAARAVAADGAEHGRRLHACSWSSAAASATWARRR